MSSLLPQFSKATALSSGVIAQSNAAFLAANPRIPGFGTITLSGTIANGDVLSLELTAGFLPNGSVTVSVALTGSDTLSSATQKLATAIVNNGTLQAFGVSAIFYNGVVVVIWPGPLGSYVTMSMTKTGTGTEAAAFSQITGGSGPIIPTADVAINVNGALLTIPAYQPFNPAPPVLAAVIATPCAIS